MTLKKFKVILSYICHECNTIFSVHVELAKNTRPYCPTCGDDFQVEKYKKPIKRPRHKNWTEEELKLLDQCIAGELKPYQVAFKTKRTMRSVGTRLTRRRKEHENLINRP